MFIGLSIERVGGNTVGTYYLGRESSPTMVAGTQTILQSENFLDNIAFTNCLGGELRGTGVRYDTGFLISGIIREISFYTGSLSTAFMNARYSTSCNGGCEICDASNMCFVAQNSPEVTTYNFLKNSYSNTVTGTNSNPSIVDTFFPDKYFVHN